MRVTGFVALVTIGASLATACERVDDGAGPESPTAGAAPTGLLAPPPTIDRPVVDATGKLSAEEVGRLSARLGALRERTGAQMAVLLVGTTHGEPIEDYSMRVAEAWRGGSADRDDGLLLTMAMLDRRMRLEVGYGLEPHVTDAEAQAILDGMRDDLRAGETARAIARAIEAVARELPRVDPSALDGGALAPPEPGMLIGAPFTLWALACVIRAPRIRPRIRRRRRRARRIRPLRARPTPAEVEASVEGARALRGERRPRAHQPGTSDDVGARQGTPAMPQKSEDGSPLACAL